MRDDIDVATDRLGDGCNVFGLSLQAVGIRLVGTETSAAAIHLVQRVVPGQLVANRGPPDVRRAGAVNSSMGGPSPNDS